jgi:hypothetical protein
MFCIAIRLFLALPSLGFVLNIPLQQGQRTPSHITNTLQVLHLFCPVPYLVESLLGFVAWYFLHFSLQGMK